MEHPDDVSSANEAHARLDEAARVIRARCGEPPVVAIVMGSGLDGFEGRLAETVEIDPRDVPHWPRLSVAGHPGRLVVGTVRGTRVAVLAGRAHLYEGHDPQSIVLPVRVMGLLGVRQVVLTNAAGAISRRMTPGSLMVIDDHIGLMGANPLAGPNDDRLGPRFPDLTEVYSARLRAVTHEAARVLGVPLRHGVYLAVPGPSYETPAEIRFFRAIGADAIGMSTVPEAIAARHMGLEVLGVSCITNVAAGMSRQPLSHADVLEVTRHVRETLCMLIEEVIRRVHLEDGR